MEVRQSLGPEAPHTESRGAPRLPRGAPRPSLHWARGLCLFSFHGRANQGSERLDHLVQVKGKESHPGVPPALVTPPWDTAHCWHCVTLCPNPQKPGWPTPRGGTDLALQRNWRGLGFLALSISPQIRHSALKCHLPLPLCRQWLNQ